MNTGKFDFGSYWGKEHELVCEVDPHYIIYCHDNVARSNISEEVYQRAIFLVKKELEALDNQLDKQENSGIVIREFLGEQEKEYEFDDQSDCTWYC